ncbi:MAG: NAD(P)-binding domain-containing protein [Myxococcota bacterium]
MDLINLPGLICVGTIIVVFVIPSWIWIEYTERQNMREHEAAKAAGRHQPVTIQPYVNLGVCMGSGACVTACPELVLKVIDGQAIAVNMAACVGHGACVTACPVSAIELVFGSEQRGIAIPQVNSEFETNVPGLYVAGELGGMGLIANAADQGVRAMQYAHKGLKKRQGSYDIAIIGAGPAGIAAALSAKERGLNYVLLEQGEVGGAVLHFPRKKLVFTRPLELPLYGTVDIPSMVKEQLVDLFRDVVTKTGLEVATQERVDAVDQRPDGGFSIQTSKRKVDAQRVILALGRRGTPRTLRVPGEEREKVAYSLLEPEHYTFDHLLVVGGGDSAVEAACTLAEQDGNQVSLSYRGNKINRPKPKNIERLRDAVAQGSVQLILESNVKEIGEDRVVLAQQGEQIVVPNDYVFVFAGGILPTDFLTKAGVRIRKHFGKRIEDVEEEPRVDAGAETDVAAQPVLPDTPLAPPAGVRASPGGEETIALPPIAGAAGETTRRLPLDVLEALLGEEATDDPATVLLPNGEDLVATPLAAPPSPARSEQTIRLSVPDELKADELPTRILKGQDVSELVAKALGEATPGPEQTRPIDPSRLDPALRSADTPVSTKLGTSRPAPESDLPPGEHTRRIPTFPGANENTDGNTQPGRVAAPPSPPPPARSSPPRGGIAEIAFGKLPAGAVPTEPLTFEEQVIQIERTLGLAGFAQVLSEVKELEAVTGEMPPAPRLNARHRLALLAGQAYFGLHEYPQAAQAFERAATYAEQQHRDAPPSPALGWLGRSLLGAQDYDRAEAVLDSALPETPDRIDVLCALHEVALRRGNRERAVQLGRKALSEATKRGDRESEATARQAIAEGLVVEGNLKGALEQLAMADERIVTIGAPALRARILARSVEIDLAIGRLGQALYRLEVLLEVVTQHPLVTRQPRAVVLLAETMRAVGLTEDAGSAALQAISLAKAEGRTADPFRVRAARVLCDLGRHAEAGSALNDAQDADEGLVDDPVGQRLALTARITAQTERHTDRRRAAALAEQAIERPPPQVAIRAAQIRLDAARAFIDAGEAPRAKASVKRGLKVIQGLAARGLKLDLMLTLHAAQPDERVAEAVVKVANRILETLPNHVHDSFRARPGLSALLQAR